MTHPGQLSKDQVLSLYKQYRLSFLVAMPKLEVDEGTRQTVDAACHF